MTILLRPSEPAKTSGALSGCVAPTEARLCRSMLHLGRKTETTLVIAGFQFEVGALARARPDQLDQPAMATDPGHGQRT